jgi:hypothetical protein
MRVSDETPDPELVPPRPEEERAEAENYRLLQRPGSTEFDVATPYGHERLRYADGQVEGFDAWHEPIEPAERHELIREIEALF